MSRCMLKWSLHFSGYFLLLSEVHSEQNVAPFSRKKKQLKAVNYFRK